MLHPDALFDQRVGDFETPDRSGSVESKAFDIQIAFGLDRAAFPAIGRQGVIRAVITRRLIELRYQLRAANGRIERGHQQAVIAPRKIAADRAGSKTTDAVGDQPLALLGNFQRPANFAAKIDFRLLHHRLFRGNTFRVDFRLCTGHRQLPLYHEGFDLSRYMGLFFGVALGAL